VSGEEIKQLRKALGLTQEEFADLLGVQYSTVNRWENGKAKPQGQSKATLTILKALMDEAKDSRGDLSIDDIRRTLREFKTGKALGWLSSALPAGIVGALLSGGAAGLIGGIVASYLMKRLSEDKGSEKQPVEHTEHAAEEQS